MIVSWLRTSMCFAHTNKGENCGMVYCHILLYMLICYYVVLYAIISLIRGPCAQPCVLAKKINLYILARRGAAATHRSAQLLQDVLGYGATRAAS